MKKMLFLLAAAVLLAGSLSACGKVSAPKPVEGSGYPHAYPHR